MKNLKRILMVCLILAVLGLAACQTGLPAPPGEQPPAPDGGETVPPATPTPSPTATHTPTPTLTPTATPGPGLDELLQTPAAYYLNAELEAAAESYAGLAALYPERADPWLGLASVAARQGEVDAHLGYLRAAVQAEPVSFEAWRQLAVVLEQLALYDEAAGAYSQMIGLIPDDPNLYTARAMAYARLGEGEQAVSDLEAAQQLDPYREYAWLNAAGAAFGRRAYQDAIQIASAGLEVYPESVSLLITCGQAALSLGDAEGALAYFDRAAAADDGSVAAHRNRGDALLALNRVDEAIEAFRTAGERGGRGAAVAQTEAYEAMSAAAGLMARTDPEGAFSYLAALVITYGQPPPLLFGYALVEYERGNPAAALSRLGGLINLYGYVPAHYWRAVILAAQGDQAGASADLAEYLRLRRAGPQVEAARALYESLGGDPDAVQP